ncbi:MAG TPA: Hint domain-containing protein [Acetobacteraceae bacterium]|nr:Hint domain-containing protein [Acetobacteraceae bacterium]
MATFIWNSDTGGTWNTASDWTLLEGTGTPPPGNPPSVNTDVAIVTSLPTAYTLTLSAGTTFNINTLGIGTDSALGDPSLHIAGTLLTSNLDYLSVGITPTTVEVDAGGVFDINSKIDDVTAVAETIKISGHGAGGLLELGNLTVFSPSVNFAFDDAGVNVHNTGVIEYQSGFTPGDTTNQYISGWDWGDSAVIGGANFTGDTVTYNAATSTLTVNSGATTVFTMTNVHEGKGANETFKIVNTDTITAVCYARETMIRTQDGEMPVERLRAGRQVMTLVDGEPVARPVKWLGHRRIDLTNHKRPETVAPIRIQRGAFADNMPHRDLVVSPDHAIFVDGKLICARQLVNGTTIRQETGWTAVDYYHVELDQHAILLAEGLPAESYIDTGNSGFFANSGAPLVLHPDLTDESGYPTREAGSCAPFVWDEASVRPVWQRLAERAAAIGRPVPQRETTAEAGLRLLAKGRTVKPIYSDGKLVIFTLPRGASEVRLVSRAQSPTEARPWLEDHRRLGVRVARIVLRGADEVREVPVDHPDLANGWWAVERDGQVISRWTDGEAVLPLPSMHGDAMLEIHLAGAMTYLAETARAA